LHFVSWWTQDRDRVLDKVEEVVTGVRPAPEPDRVLATIVSESVRDLGIELRAGVHTGECELRGERELEGLGPRHVFAVART
jgi:hypothetical protein